MIRFAAAEDAEQLFELNRQFNGPEAASRDSVRQALESGGRELVVVAEEAGSLLGFVCVQIKRSFCYAEAYAEITEVFVKEEARRQGLAGKMIGFAEDFCSSREQIRSFELHTGGDNLGAQALYCSLGYGTEGEVLFRKRLPAPHGK